MKRIFALILCFLLFIPAGYAENKPQFYDLEPGLYEIGKDIPAGKYDIRFNKLNANLTITYSYTLNEKNEPNLSDSQSFTFSFSSSSNWWNIGSFLVTLYPGYLLIQNSPCRLWIEK